MGYFPTLKQWAHFRDDVIHDAEHPPAREAEVRTHLLFIAASIVATPMRLFRPWWKSRA